MNRLYLLEPDTLIGYIITWITKSRYSHAAIMYNGVLYDSSETRGTFNVSDIDISTREHTYYEFEGDLSEWLKDMEDTLYDWRGVFGWVLGLNDSNKFYCFETAWKALKCAGFVDSEPPIKLSGATLESLFKD